MKHAKTLGLLAVAIAALMAFAGPASATTLTSPTGTTLGNGSVIEATSTNAKLDGTVIITCTHSVVKGEITETHVVKGTITTLDFTGCNHTVTVTAKGTLTIDSAHVVRSTGAIVTAVTHSAFLGTIHCIWETKNTAVGSLTDSHTTGATAVLDIGTAPIPEVTTSPFCGNDAEWTGNYTVTSPDNLYVD